MRLTREERRVNLTQHYLTGIGFAGIFIVGNELTPRLMLVTDLVSAISALERDPASIVLRRFWFSNAAVATRTFRDATALGESHPVLESEGPVERLTSLVVFAADHFGVELRDDGVVLAQCAAAVDEIERSIEQARVGGGLKDVNSAYKQHRVEMGASAFPYEEWLHQYKLKAVEIAAHRVRSVLRSATV